MGWLRSRSPREKTVFQELFDLTFFTVYTWGTQNLTMDVLQCNIVCQMLHVLEGLVPVAKKEDEANVTHSSTESAEEDHPEEQAPEIKDEMCSAEHLHRL